MTTDQGPFGTPIDPSPRTGEQARGPWKQIAIVLASAVILAATSCAAMIGTFGNHEQVFEVLTLLFAIGLVGILVALVWTIIALALKFSRKRRESA